MNTSIISEGADPLCPATGYYTGRAGRHGQARNSFQFWVGSLPASRPMSSRHFMCMALQPTDEVHDNRS